MGSKKFWNYFSNSNNLKSLEAKYTGGPPLRQFPLMQFPLTQTPLKQSPLTWTPLLCFFALLCIIRRISSLNGLTKWSLKKSSQKELSKRALRMRYPIKISKWSIKIKTLLKSFGSLVVSLLGALLGVCWVSVESLICEIHGIINFQASSLNGLSNRALSKQLSTWALQIEY
jgi:hypothetical protein